MDYKEYSRLRSIARKRIERASAAGKAEYTFIPTVAQVKKSANPDAYMRAIREYLKMPSLKDKPSGGASLPTINIPGGQLPTVRKPTTEEQKARRREQNRRSKAKRAVEQASKSEGEAKKRVSYLRALETLAMKWREAGIDIGNWLGVLSPKKAKAFTDYVEYRFSQAKYNDKYVIDVFIKDFGEMVKRQYNFNDIEQDFGKFLEKQKQLSKNKRKTNKYGITEDEINTAWKKFVKGV